MTRSRSSTAAKRSEMEGARTVATGRRYHQGCALRRSADPVDELAELAVETGRVLPERHVADALVPGGLPAYAIRTPSGAVQKRICCSTTGAVSRPAAAARRPWPRPGRQ